MQREIAVRDSADIECDGVTAKDQLVDSKDESAPSHIEDELYKQFVVHMENRGFDLVDVTHRREHRGWVLRFTVDRLDGSLTVEDGVSISRELSAAIEADPRLDHLLTGPYNLEVTSPGIFRPLTRARDFERAWGKRVKVEWKEPAEGIVMETVGDVKAYGDGVLVLNINDKVENKVKEIQIDVQTIQKAHLEPKLPFGKQ